MTDAMLNNLIGFTALVVSFVTILIGWLQSRRTAATRTVEQLSRRVDELTKQVDRLTLDNEKCQTEKQRVQEENLMLMRRLLAEKG